jgi:hypothetical protein
MYHQWSRHALELVEAFDNGLDSSLNMAQTSARLTNMANAPSAKKPANNNVAHI